MWYCTAETASLLSIHGLMIDTGSLSKFSFSKPFQFWKTPKIPATHTAHPDTRQILKIPDPETTIGDKLSFGSVFSRIPDEVSSETIVGSFVFHPHESQECGSVQILF